MFYYLSLGSNINPQENMASILKWLVEEFGCLVVYPVIETEPEELSTDNKFLNTLVILHSKQNEIEIKHSFNSLEERLGRDRKDPQRSYKDRAADVDILACDEEFNPHIFEQFDESYIKQVLAMRIPAQQILLDGLSLGDRPATIYLDRATGQKRIVDNKLDGLNDWLETGFVGQ